MAVTIASAVRSQPSRMPNDRCAVSRIDVISSGGRKRLSMRNRFRVNVTTWYRSLADCVILDCDHATSSADIADSSIIMCSLRCSWSIAGLLDRLLAPDGQRMITRSTAAATPRPKCTRR